LPSLVEIRSSSRLADLPLDTRKSLIKLFGSASAESAALAAREGLVLWTDDLALAEVTRNELGEKRVWSQQVMSQRFNDGRLAEERFVDLTLFLLQWNYTFTRIAAPIVVEA